jgi:NADPH:quinone reductase-like Zn-dependent oxidoreductase
MIKELGADVVFDHYDPDCGKKINEYTKNKLFYAFDCYSEGQSPKVCCDALSSTTAPDGKKPRWNTILTAKPTRDGVDVGFTLAYTIWGEDVVFRGTKIPTKPEDFEFAKKFWDTTEKLLAEGKIKTHRAEVRPGGLDGILSGLDDLEHQRVSGKKLVYRIGEN